MASYTLKLVTLVLHECIEIQLIFMEGLHMVSYSLFRFFNLILIPGSLFVVRQKYLPLLNRNVLTVPS